MADDDVIDDVDEFDEDLEVDLDEERRSTRTRWTKTCSTKTWSSARRWCSTKTWSSATRSTWSTRWWPSPPLGPARRCGDDEVEEDEEVVDPDDVEADLDTILKDRIAAADDEEDEEEVEVADTRGPETPDGVTPKKANEFVCTGCFLLVNRGQFGPADQMACPVGESDCPAITVLQKAKK